MSYIVLARKWRPQSFDDLIGQDAAVRTFKNALTGDKIAHAYLFSGPRGVGKTSSARILAKALNCISRTDSEPCGKCHSCTAITDSASVDVIEIDGASNNSVEAVRELRETVQYAPSGSKYKIYIIDEVHMLSTSAFNALLKTLEEPPAHVVFIFATTEPKKIPSTILSRCQHHSFRRITKKEIRNQLLKITETEKITIRDDALEMIARAADGSMRDALTLLDQANSFSDEITLKELQSLLGLPESEIISNLSEAILTGNISASLSIIKDLTDRGNDLRQITKELVEHFRNITIVKTTQVPEEILEFTNEEINMLKNLVSDVSLEQLTLLLSELLKLEAEVRTSINPRYTLELGLFKTVFAKNLTSIDDLLKVIGESPQSGKVSEEKVTEDKLHGCLTEKKTVTDTNDKSESSSDITHKDAIWKKLLDKINSEDHLLACKLSEAKHVNVTNTELEIGFNGGMSVLADSVKSKSSIIKPILEKISGQNLTLKILSLPFDKAAKSTPKKIRDDVFSEPLVKDAIRIFNGKLIKVRPLENKEETGTKAQRH